MGKAKRQKQKPHKENPTGLMSVKDFEEVETFTDEDREKVLQRVYEDVQSTQVENKLSGLQTLESMSCSSVMANRIAKDKIAKLIGPLLVDNNIIVRTATASALRHVADNGGEAACANLIKDDIMTPLATLLKKDYYDWELKSDSKDKSKMDNAKETLIQTVTLLWTLCENNELAIKYSNSEDLVSIISKFLNVVTCGIDVAIVAAQCMLSLSEDNVDAIQQLQSCESVLLDLLNIKVTDNASVHDIILFKTLITGLLINLVSYTEQNKTHITNKVISVLAETLSVNHLDLLQDLAKILSTEKTDFSKTTKKKIKEIKNLFGAQQQALEIIANICTDSKENFTDSDLDDSDTTENESVDLDTEPMDDGTFNILTLPIEVIEIINNCDVINKICSKTMTIKKDSKNTLSQSTEGKYIIEQMHRLQCRACLCLNNLMLSLEIDALGGVENVYRIWAEIGAVAFGDVDPNDIELLEAATAAMRATLQKLAETKSNAFNKLTLADIQPMLNTEKQCPNANVRANLIRILGNLSLIIMNSDFSADHELIKQISLFLLEICATECAAWVIAESLDTVMDIFSEDDTDQLAADIELVGKLYSLVNIFKNKVQQQKRTLKENISVISTVNGNITRFIKYKEKRLKILGRLK